MPSRTRIVRLARLSVDYGTAHKPSSASTATSVWRTTPAVMRMQPAQPGSRERSRTQDAALGERPDDVGGLAARSTLISTKLPALVQ